MVSLTAERWILILFRRNALEDDLVFSQESRESEVIEYGRLHGNRKKRSSVDRQL